MIRALALSMALMVGAGAANAEYLTGAKLLQGLEGLDGPTAKTAAEGYVVGVFDATKGAAHCAPEIPIPDLVAAIKATLKGNPELLDKNADQAIWGPLSQVFPCRGPGAGRPS